MRGRGTARTRARVPGGHMGCTRCGRVQTVGQRGMAAQGCQPAGASDLRPCACPQASPGGGGDVDGRTRQPAGLELCRQPAGGKQGSREAGKQGPLLPPGCGASQAFAMSSIKWQARPAGAQRERTCSCRCRSGSAAWPPAGEACGEPRESSGPQSVRHTLCSKPASPASGATVLADARCARQPVQRPPRCAPRPSQPSGPSGGPSILRPTCLFFSTDEPSP